jgi:NAD+ kinase
MHTEVKIALLVDDPLPSVVEYVVHILNKKEIDPKVISNYDELKLLSDYNVLILVGTDNAVLKALQAMGENSIPIFPISPPGHYTFFASVAWEELEKAINKLISGDYTVEKYSRIKAVIDGSKVVHALNEIALFSYKSATLLEYYLIIDNEFVWRDIGDGVIVATQAGSTAYAFSAGGPIVMGDANVFVIVPVNSLNPMRRPLVIPDQSEITLTNINSMYHVEVIADGIVRIKVNNEVKITKAENHAYFVKLFRRLSDAIKKKAKLAEEIQDIPPSAKFVLKMLKIYGESSVKELAERTGLSERTVRYALSVLMRKGLVRRLVNLRDTRQRLYRAT